MSSLPPLNKPKVVREFRSSRLSTIHSAGSSSRLSSKVSRIRQPSSQRQASSQAPPPTAAPTSSRAAMWAAAIQSTHPEPPPLTGGNATPGAPPQLPTGGAAGNTWQQVQTVKQQARHVALKVIESKVLTALVVFLVTVLLLVCINPPMAQEALSPEELQQGVQAARSWKKIMVWSALVFVVALLLPVAAGHWRSASPVVAQ